jgi:hypothetical protein
MNCSICAAELGEGARFCAVCGARVGQPDRNSDFEIGKIAALASVKADVLKWLGGSAAILAGVFGVLAYFGMNELLKDTVSEQIKTELKQNREEIEKSLKDVFISVGKASRDQEEISKLLTDTRSKLQATDEERNRLSTAVVETDKQREQLVSIIQQLNIASFLDKLKYDFYHVRQFSAKIDLFAKPHQKFDADMYANLDLWQTTRDDSGNEDHRRIGQMRLILPNTNIRNEDEEMIEISGNCELYQPFEEFILNKHISSLDHIDWIFLTYYAPMDQKDELEHMKEGIQSGKITINVNWMPLLNFKFDLPKNLIDSREENGRWTVRIKASIASAARPIVEVYEQLFQETVTRGP